MDTNSFIVYIKTEDIYEDIAKVVDSRYDTSNYKLNRLLPKGKKNWINERWFKWENDERVCCIERKIIFLSNRQH